MAAVRFRPSAKATQTMHGLLAWGNDTSLRNVCCKESTPLSMRYTLSMTFQRWWSARHVEAVKMV